MASDNHVNKASKLVLLPVLNETRCACECKNRLEGCNKFQVIYSCVPKYIFNTSFVQDFNLILTIYAFVKKF